ncbi:hypothetical protein DVH05_010055 [Phytophthora capsici]|nr:hypothetical protein DVH05_010055 [Phytophthora capsici]
MVNENVARLRLPKRLLHLYPFFNVDLLVHYPEQPERFRTRSKSKETPIELPDEEEDDGLRAIERLHSKRQFNRKPEYLVKWLGEPESESTWEQERDIKHVVHWDRLVKELRDQRVAKGNSTGGDCQLLVTSSNNPRANRSRRLTNDVAGSQEQPSTKRTTQESTHHGLQQSTPSPRTTRRERRSERRHGLLQRA